MAHSHDGQSAPRLSDEELEYYGDLYIRWAFREAGVDFESFLNHPDYYLQKHTRGGWRAGRGDGDAGRRSLRSYLWGRQATRTPPE
jgi:hypothetical protein